ncbi:MAG: hypothetical protein ACREJM_03480, partial [Candidatus Saccharimonadales bacterium]
YDAQTKNDAQALDTLVKTDADQLSSEAATEDGAGNYPSPWMDQWKAQAAAADAKADANADAALTQANTDADAQDTQEKSAADAEQTKDDAAAQAAHDKIVSDAQAAHDKSIADATSITNAVAKNSYTAALPTAYSAFDWSGVPTPAMLDAAYAELYAVDDIALPLSAGQDDGGSPLPPGDVIGAMYITPALGGASVGNALSGVPSGATAPILGQSFSLGGTVDPFGDIASWTTPTGAGLLSDNNVYAPANPNLGFTGWPGAQWLNVGETIPASGGGSGSGGSGGQQAPQTPPMPPTDPKAARKTNNELGPDESRGEDPWAYHPAQTPIAKSEWSDYTPPEDDFSWYGDRVGAENERTWVNWFAGVTEGPRAIVEEALPAVKQAAQHPIDTVLNAAKGAAWTVTHPGPAAYDVIVPYMTAPSARAAGQMFGKGLTAWAAGEVGGAAIGAAGKAIGRGRTPSVPKVRVPDPVEPPVIQGVAKAVAEPAIAAEAAA